MHIPKILRTLCKRTRTILSALTIAAILAGLLPPPLVTSLAAAAVVQPLDSIAAAGEAFLPAVAQRVVDQSVEQVNRSFTSLATTVAGQMPAPTVAWADSLTPLLGDCVGGGCLDPYPDPIQCSTSGNTPIATDPAGRDNGYSVIVGGNYAVYNDAVGVEGRTYVRGDLRIDKKDATNISGSGPDSSYLMGTTDVGACVVPDNNTDHLLVQGNINVTSGSNLDVSNNLYGGVTGAAVYGLSSSGTMNAGSGTRQEDLSTHSDNFAAMLTEIRTRSQCYAAEPTSTNAVLNGHIFTCSEVQSGSATTCPAGLYVYNIDAIPNIVEFDGFEANGDHTILVNVTGTGIYIDTDFSGSYGASPAPNNYPPVFPLREYILWNFPNAQTLHMNGSNDFEGSVLIDKPYNTAAIRVSGLNGRLMTAGNLVHDAEGQSSVIRNYPFRGTDLPACATVTPGQVTGRVMEDTNNDNLGDTPLAGVTLELLDDILHPVIVAGNPVVAQTDAAGYYTFTNLLPGSYAVSQVQPLGYTSVSGADGGDDSDAADDGIPNVIPLILSDGETDSGNDYVERAKPPLNPLCSETAYFNWSTLPNTGNEWSRNNSNGSSETYTVNYTDAQGNSNSVDVTLTLDDPLGRNCGYGINKNVWGGAVTDPWDSSTSCPSALGTATNDAYGAGYLTWVMVTKDHTEDMEFHFDFSKPVEMGSFEVSDIDYSGMDINNLYVNTEEPGNSYQDEVYFSASNGGTNVPVAMAPGAKLIVDSANQTVRSEYNVGVQPTIPPTDLNYTVVASTNDTLDSFTVGYSNGIDDANGEAAYVNRYAWWSNMRGATNGASDDHAVRLSGFEFCVYDDPGTPAIEVTKSSDVTSTVRPGETIDYTVIVENTGDITVNNVIVTDTVPAGTTYVVNSSQLSYQNGTITRAAGTPPLLVTAADGISLAPGDRLVVTMQVLVDNPVADTSIRNVVYVAVDELPEEEIDYVVDPVETPVGALEVNKVVVGDSAYAPGPWLFNLSVEPATCDISDVATGSTILADGSTTYLYSNLPVTDASGNSCQYTVGETVVDGWTTAVAPDATVTLTADQTTAVTFTNTAAPVQFGDRVLLESDGDGLADTGVITPVLGMVITATNGVNVETTTTDAAGYYSFTLAAGTYTVHYGAVPAQYGDMVPSLVVSGTTESGNAGSYRESGDPDANHGQDTTVTLAPGEANWHIDFIFTSAPIFDLALVKRLANGQSSAVQPGDLITYTLMVQNQGTVDAFDIDLIDYLPADMTLADGDWSDNGTSAGYTIARLNASEAISVDITLQLSAVFTGTTVANWAEVADASDTDGGVTAEDIDSTPDNQNGNTPGEDGNLVDDETTADGKNGGDEDDHDLAVVTVTPLAGTLIVRKAVAVITNCANVVTSRTPDPTAVNNGSCVDIPVAPADYATIEFAFTDDVATSAGVLTPTFMLHAGEAMTFTNVEAGDYTVAESVPVGWDLTAATCSNGDTPDAVTVGGGVTVTCVFTNTPTLVPAIELEKETNGEDADTSTGPTLFLGDTVTWTYEITNTGNVTLTDITLVDDMEGDITASCPVTTLSPGEGTSCIVTGIATLGQYSNTAIVTGTPTIAWSTPITDSDPSHYIAVERPVQFGDRVFLETDGDGLANSGDTTPIAGMVITATAGNNSVYTTTTDVDGYYSFTVPAGSYIVTYGAVPASYGAAEPSETPAGAAEIGSAGSYAEVGDPDQSHAQATTVTLSPGEANWHIDFAFTPLPVQFGDRVFLETDGDGLANSGDITPIAGMVITATASDNTVYTTTTDVDGYYSFTVPAGAYIVTYGAVPASYGAVEPSSTPGGNNEAGNAGLYQEAGDPDQSHANGTTVTLVAGEANWHIDFAFTPLHGAIGNYVWMDENSDGYQDAGEPGIPNVRVVLYDDQGNQVSATWTDSSGHYLFPNLLLGDYFVNVDETTLPAGMRQTPPSTLPGADFGNQDQSDDPANGDYGYPATITQAVPENLTADFGYNANPQPEVDGGDGLAALGDRIWIDSDGDGAQDPDEIGVAGVEVTLYGDPDGDGIYETVLATETTDVTGFYLFDGLEAGAYVVEVTDSSSASHDVLDSASYEQTGDPDHFGRPGLDNDNLSTVPVVLAPGDIFLNVDFGYQPTGALLGSIGDTIWFDADADGNGPALPAVDGVDAVNQGAGTEDDGGEYGIPGVSVALIADTNGNGAWDAGEPIIATDVTDASGQYLFTGLPLDDGSGDASYLVWVNDTANVLAEMHPTYDYDDGTSAPDGLSARTLSTSEPDARDQDFGYTPQNHQPGLGLIGDTVWFDVDGSGGDQSTQGDEPGVEGVVMELLDNNGIVIATTTTDENGTYYFGGLPLDESYQVRVAATNFEPDNVLAELSSTYDPDGGDDGVGPVVTLTAAAPINLEQDFSYVYVPPIGEPVGQIGNLIWLDANANGLYEPALGESPIGGVTVDLYRDLNGNGELDPGEPLLASTVTSDTIEAATYGTDGNYLFTGLPAGDYIVDVSDEAGLLAGYWHSLGETAVDNNSQHDPYAVTIGNGEPMANLTADFGYYVDPAAVGNYVWFDVNQDGIQNDGETGINGVTVVMTITYPNGTESVLVTTTANDPISDRPGWYSFGNLLLDEDYNGDGQGDEPSFVIAVDPTQAALRTYLPTLVDEGVDDTADSDEHSGVAAQPVQGQLDTSRTNDGAAIASYDFGFIQRFDLALHKVLAGSTNLPVMAGDDITFTLVINNQGTVDAYNIEVSDFLPLAFGLSVNDTNGWTAAGKVVTNIVPFLAAGEEAQLTIVVAVDPYAPGGQFVNRAEISAADNDTDPNNTPPTDIDSTPDRDPNNEDNVKDNVIDEDGTTPTGDEDDHDIEVIEVLAVEPNETSLGAIGNYVWMDENSDGYQDAGEPGIPNVRVVLYDDQGNQVSETWTDSSGHYLFPNLPLGDYFVNVDETTLPAGMSQTPPSTLPGADFGNQDQSDDPANGDYGYPATITQAVPENLTADFGYNANPQPEVDGGDGLAALGDRIWIDSDGDGVQDPDEIGVAGVEVTLYGDPDGDGIYETVLATETTDVTGFYLFDGLEAGAYVVEVTDSSSASHDVLDSASYEQTGDPDHFGRPGLDNDNLSTVPVVLAPGDIFLNVDFGYQPTGVLLGSIGDTLWFDADADGNGPALPAVDGVDAVNQGAGAEDDGGEYGIPGVSVALIADTNGNGAWDAGEPIIATDVTDASGQYLFTGLPLDDGSGDASYLVWGNDTANVLAEMRPTYDYDDGTSAPDGLSARTLSTSKPDARDQDFGYTPIDHNPSEGTIGDTVWLDLDQNGVQDAGEHGIEGVVMELTDIYGQTSTTVTDENGHYYFDNLNPTGLYTVTVAATNFQPSGVLADMTNTGDPDDDGIAANGDEDGQAVADLGAVGSDGNADEDGDNAINLGQDFGYIYIPPIGEPVGQIGNLIWLDANANGLYEPALGESPIGGVTVDFYRDLNGNGELDPGEPLLASTVTDSTINDTAYGTDGNYLFTGLPAGDYIVDVSDEAGLLAGYWHSLGETAVDNNSQRDPYAVTIGNGEPMVNLTADFGYYVDPAAVGNYVWFDVNQDGIQNDGETGINGVTVVMTITYPNGTESVLVTTTANDPISDRPGWYSFGNLLLDEDYNGDGQGDEPSFVIAVDPTQAALRTYLPTLVDEGVDDSADSDEHSGVAAQPVQGQLDTSRTNDGAAIASYDFGFIQLFDLALHKVLAGSTNLPVMAGDDITFTLVINNQGTVDAYNIEVSDFLPTGLSLSANDTNGWTVNGAVATHLVASLAAGAETTVDIVLTIDANFAGTSLTNVAEISAADDDTDPNNTPPTDTDSTLDRDPNNEDNVKDNVINEDGTLPGEDEDDHDIEIISVQPPASLGDLVWEDLNHDGVQDGHEPGIAGVTVTLTTPTGVLLITTTDETGHYTFTNLVPNEPYTVTFVTPTGYQPTMPNVAAADLDSNGAVAIVTLDPDEHDPTIDSGFWRPLTLGNQIWEDLNNNGLIDANETGIIGVMVNLYRDSNNDGQPDGAALATVQSDADGLYLFTNLISDTYLVEIVAPNGYVSSAPDAGDADVDADDGDDNGVGSNGGLIRSAPVTLSPGDEPMAEQPDNSGATADVDANLTVDFGLWRPASLGNLVWEDLNHNGVQDVNEPGIQGVTVTLTTPTGVVITTTTDPSGHYTFTELISGVPYTVTFVTPDGYTPTLPNSGDDATDSDGNIVVVTLQPGEYNDTIDSGFWRPAGLGDRVWYDDNRNGVQDNNEAGVADVTVELLDSNGQVLSTMMTNGSGWYSFTNLPTGDYAIRFVPSTLPTGYVFTAPNQGGDVTADSDADPSTGETVQTTLLPGEFDPTWDAGILLPPVNLGDLVWLDGNRDGLQNNGEPGVADIMVTLELADGTLLTTTTDASGHYTFTDLVPNQQVTVTFTLPTGYSVTTPNTGDDALDSDPDSSGVVVVNLYTTDDLTIDAGLLVDPVVVGDRAFIDVNRNGVQDGEDQPLAGVVLHLTRADGSAAADINGNPVTDLTTDANGNYRFANLPPAEYTVTVVTVPTGYAPTAAQVGDPANDSSTDTATSSPTTGTAAQPGGEDLTLDFGFVPVVNLGNLVWLDSNNNGQVDGGEPGIPAVTVQLFREGDDPTTATPVMTDVTDEDGHYLFADLEPGRYYVYIPTPPEAYPMSSTATDTSDNGEDNDDNGIQAAPGAPVTSPVIELAVIGEPVNDGDGENGDLTIDFALIPLLDLGNLVWHDVNNNGQVDEGEPGIANVTVQLFREGDDPTTATPLQTTTTDENGNYLFENLEPGGYVVYIPTPPTAYPVSTVPTDEQDNGEEGDDNGIQEQQGQPVRSPIIDLSVGAEPTNDGDDANGDLTVDFGFFALASLGDLVWFDLDQDGVQDASETGEPGTLDERGVPNVLVTLYDGITNSVVATTTTNTHGHYLFDDLLPGSYVVEFALPDGYLLSPVDQGSTDVFDSDVDPTTMRTPVTVLDSGEHNPTLDMGLYLPNGVEPAAIGDRVWYDANQDGLQDEGELGVPGVIVTLHRSDGSIVATTVTDVDGFYQFNSLPPGDYYLDFTPPAGYGISAQDQGDDDTLDSDVDPNTRRTAVTTLEAGEYDPTWDLGLTLATPPASIGDLVWFDGNGNGLQDEGELGVPGVMVTLYRADGTAVATTRTDADGYYEFINLPPGDYYLEFTPRPGYVSTQPNQGDDGLDSDVDPATRRTTVTTLEAGEADMTWDYGLLILDTRSGNLVVPSTIGNRVWDDVDRDGIQDDPVTEPGVPGVTVKLYNSDGEIIAIDVTDENGEYSFPNILPGEYYVEFVLPDGYEVTVEGNDPTSDTDSNADPNTGRTPVELLEPGETNPTLDAGIYLVPTNLGEGEEPLPAEQYQMYLPVVQR